MLKLQVSPEDLVHQVIDRCISDQDATLRFHGESDDLPTDLSLTEVGISQATQVDLQVQCTLPTPEEAVSEELPSRQYNDVNDLRRSLGISAQLPQQRATTTAREIVPSHGRGMRATSPAPRARSPVRRPKPAPRAQSAMRQPRKQPTREVRDPKQDREPGWHRRAQEITPGCTNLQHDIASNLNPGNSMEEVFEQFGPGHTHGGASLSHNHSRTRARSPTRGVCIAESLPVGGWNDTHDRIAAAAAPRWNTRAELGMGNAPSLLHAVATHAMIGVQGLTRGHSNAATAMGVRPGHQSNSRIHESFPPGGWEDAYHRRVASGRAAAMGERNILPRSSRQPTRVAEGTDLQMNGSAVTQALLARGVGAPYPSTRRFIH